MSEIRSQITGLKISGGKNIFQSKSNSKLKTSSCRRGTGIAQSPSHGRVSAASAGTDTKPAILLKCNNRSTFHQFPIQPPFHSFTCPWFFTNPPTQKWLWVHFTLRVHCHSSLQRSCSDYQAGKGTSANHEFWPFPLTRIISIQLEFEPWKRSLRASSCGTFKGWMILSVLFPFLVCLTKLKANTEKHRAIRL